MEKVISSLADPNNRIALRDKPTTSLILSLVVYKACSMKWLIDSAPSIFSYASYTHLTKPINFIIRHTVFNQFVGGESSEDCQKTISKLKDQGIGVILALSVETDVDDVEERNASHQSIHMNQQADFFMDATKQCVLSAGTQPGNFIALKISALTSPLLLQKVTGVLSDLYESFGHHTSVSSHTLSQSQVCHVVAQHRGLVNVEENVPEIIHNNNEVDIVDFKQMMLLHRPAVMSLLSNILTEQDQKDWLRMLHRVDEICSLAKSCGVKVLIDAEQSYLQLAIDQAASVMEQKHNQLGSRPTVFNTYQMYTKTALPKLKLDLLAAERYKYGLGVKLVRGAYMVKERARAAELGYSDPIQNTINDTHESYHSAILLLSKALEVTQHKTGNPVTEETSPLSFVIASHNHESIMYACNVLQHHHISLDSGVVSFGQLYGMADNISYTLSQYCLPVYKYLPYGEVEQVIPYLIRRGQENAAMMERTKLECELIVDELRYRFLQNMTRKMKE
ncbi:FAD-linked oxidoreductase-like protein [Umbelopsis sp. AD052]|nr:FAD-linked oxidoreductase-like protein [Umbelopsis sp. AD052]